MGCGASARYRVVVDDADGADEAADAKVALELHNLSGETWKLTSPSAAKGVKLKESVAKVLEMPVAEVVLILNGKRVSDYEAPLAGLAGAAEEELAVLQVQVLRESRRLALTGSFDSTLKLWDLDSGECAKTFIHGGRVHCLSVDWTHHRAVSGGSDGCVKLWNLSTGKCLRTLHGHKSSVFCVSVDWGHLQALSGGADGIVNRMDLNTVNSMQPLRELCVFLCVSVDWNSSHALSGSEYSLKLWDLSSGECRRTFPGHKRGVTCVDVDWSRRLALSGSEDRTLRFWDLNEGTLLATLGGHNLGVTCVFADWANSMALSASSTLKLWDLKRHECVETLWDHPGSVCAAMDWGGRRAISCSSKATLMIWDLEINARAVKKLVGHLDEISCVAINVPPFPQPREEPLDQPPEDAPLVTDVA